MNRKLLLLSLFACVVVATSFIIFTPVPNPTAEINTHDGDAVTSDVSSSTIAKASASYDFTNDPLSTMTPSSKSLELRAYRAVIRSKLTSRGVVLADFSNALSIEFDTGGVKPHKGVAYDVKFESEDPKTEIPSYLGFTFNYQAGEFSDVSMLGLPPQHPLNIVTALLAQFSYFDGIHSLQLPDGTHTYLYDINGNQVTREKATDSSSSASYATLSERETWNLTLDASSFPSQLHSSTGKTVEMEGSELQLEQEITMTPIKPDALILAKVSFGAGVNAKYKVAFNDTAPAIEVNEENFMETLVLFDANPNLDTAQALGLFLVNQGWGYVRDLLSSDEITDSMRSSLIFALERSGEREGEYLLASLIEDDSLGETDRLRAIMSIVKMGEINSQVALSTLQNMLDHSNSLLGQTAMLNIGILGKQNPRMTSDVTAFLTQRLSSEGAGYNELLAISNLGNPEMDSRVLPYLDSQYADERQVAVKLLSRNPDMQPTLLKQMLNDEHPSVVKAITLGIETNSQDLQLTESYQAQLRSRLDEPDILAPTRDLLFMFLANNAQPTALNKSAARKMLETQGVSESTLTLAQQLLKQ
ncbi:HEAT repeat domain-containing protein [Enterovibrio sp. FF113]|uniref:HEAT repeat domain-containing protein n=1 Tax=Enterovibrio sp. FF113 TaxID=3230010 RepID=UPI00352DE019